MSKQSYNEVWGELSVNISRLKAIPIERDNAVKIQSEREKIELHRLLKRLKAIHPIYPQYYYNRQIAPGYCQSNSTLLFAYP